jgi:hypothetical protein
LGITTLLRAGDPAHPALERGRRVGTSPTRRTGNATQCIYCAKSIVSASVKGRTQGSGGLGHWSASAKACPGWCRTTARRKLREFGCLHVAPTFCATDSGADLYLRDPQSILQARNALFAMCLVAEWPCAGHRRSKANARS